MRRISIALLHHPVLGRGGEVLTTTLTNLDLHDMARSARAYGVHRFFAVHPYASQRMLAERIQRHWLDGAGGRRIPDRRTALEVLDIVPDLDAVSERLGGEPELWTTAAQAKGGAATGYAAARARLAEDGRDVLVCFGTGWGLADSVLERAEVRLEPIRAGRDTGYNHLSVRAACAITLDRLLGPLTAPETVAARGT